MHRTTGDTELRPRDRRVVELVAKFRQMTTRQIRDSLFADLASATPLDRTLKRLLEQKHLGRLMRPIGGGGGSGPFVYQLGRAGWKLLDKPGDYWAPRAVNLHTLAVADCYVALLHSGLEVIQFITEPECHQSVGNSQLTPDAYVELGDHAKQVKYSLFVEMDRGTEHLDTIQDKCSRYWGAYQAWQYEYFPTVLFVAPDERRVRQLRDAVEGGPSDSHALFRLATQESFVSIARGAEEPRQRSEQPG